MAVRVTLRWNEKEFRRITDGQTVPQAVWRAAGVVRDRAKRNITSAGRVNTGAMRNSITARRISQGGGEVRYRVGSELKYALYQHEGTRSPIAPRRAKVLRFKAGGKTVFAARVRGVQGVPFLTDALKTLSVNDFTS